MAPTRTGRSGVPLNPEPATSCPNTSQSDSPPAPLLHQGLQQPLPEVASTDPHPPSTIDPGEPLPREALDINPALSQAEQDLIYEALKPLAHAFARKDSTPSAAPGVEHVINLKNSEPFKHQPYRQSPAKAAVIANTVKDLEARGLIRPSTSETSSPVILVPKGPKDWRMCIDFRKLNTRTIKDNYPMPLIERCLQVCRRARWLSSLDIKDAFHHIPLSPGSIPLTAFVTADGLYEWIRMPFGLCNAPATFQRYVDHVLAGLIGKTCVAFFDDCVCGTEDESLRLHMDAVIEILQRLADKGLEVNIKKCQFGYHELVFVGHVIGNGILKADPSKVKAMQEFPRPTTVTEVKSFLGMINYYSKFIPGFAYMATPLIELTRKGVPFEWSADRATAFENLKAAVTSAPVLRTPSFGKRFHLACDASGKGIAGVLSQEHDGTLHPCCFISRQLSSAEQNYTGTERECLACVWAIGQFEHYLIDAEFDLETDHSALTWMMHGSAHNSRVQRWVLKLQDFTFLIHHRPGKELVGPDTLSRAPLPGTAPLDSTTSDPAHAPQEREPRRVRRVISRITQEPLEFLDRVRFTRPAPAGFIPHFYRGSLPERVTPLAQATVQEITHRVRRASASSSTSASQPSPPEPVQNPQELPLDLVLVDLAEIKELVKAQRTDSYFGPIYCFLKDKTINQNLSDPEKARIKRVARNFVLQPQKDGPEALFHMLSKPKVGSARFMGDLLRLCVPTAFQAHLLTLFHSSPFGAHLGIKRTLRKICTRYYWPTVAADVTTFVGKCQPCLHEKIQRRPTPGVPTMWDPPDYPFHTVSMDFVGKLPPSEDFIYILMIVCHFTGWAIAVPTTNTTSETVARCLLDEVICRFGMPLRILTDRGESFRSQLLKTIYARLGTKAAFTSSYHPQTNGKVERLNSTIKEMLKCLSSNKLVGDQWSQHLQLVTFAYNTSQSDVTGFSPYFLLFGREAITPSDALAVAASLGDQEPVLVRGQVPDSADVERVENYAAQITLNIQTAHSLVQSLLDSKRQEVEAKRRSLARIPVFAVGDLVLVRTMQASAEARKDKSRIGAQLFSGPFRILARTSQNSYDVQLCHSDGTLLKGRGTQPSSVNVDRLKLYSRLPKPDQPSAASESEPESPNDSPPVDPDGVAPMEVDPPASAAASAAASPPLPPPSSSPSTSSSSTPPALTESLNAYGPANSADPEPPSDTPIGSRVRERRSHLPRPLYTPLPAQSSRNEYSANRSKPSRPSRPNREDSRRNKK